MIEALPLNICRYGFHLGVDRGTIFWLTMDCTFPPGMHMRMHHLGKLHADLVQRRRRVSLSITIHCFLAVNNVILQYIQLLKVWFPLECRPLCPTRNLLQLISKLSHTITSINVMRSPTELKILALCVVHPFF